MKPWLRPRHPEARRRQFETLAHEHGAALLGVARRLTGNPTEAEDLVQEALIKAYVAFDQFAAGTNFRGWVIRILVNTHISRHRHHQRQPATVAWEDLGGPSRDAFDLPGPDPDPETEVLSEVLDPELAPALAALPDEFRQAVVMADMLELSYQEIAQLTQVPLGTVRSRIFRGRRLLRESLREYALERGLL